MKWLEQFRCRCPEAEPPPTIVKVATRQETVPPTSPAHILAASLTEPETAGEWAREWVNPENLTNPFASGRMEYRNAKRDITVSRYFGYSQYQVISPFTLSEAEQGIVLAAMEAFDARLKRLEEARALARLVAVEAKEQDQ